MIAPAHRTDRDARARLGRPSWPRRRRIVAAVIAAAITGACAGAMADGQGAGSRSTAGSPDADPPIAVPELVIVAAGPFIAGSSAAEREAAYGLDETGYGHSATRNGRWYAGERQPETVDLPGFAISRTPITNAQYAVFLAETGHRAPDADPREWASYRLVHPYERTRRHAWQGGELPDNRADHPVVLVSHADARAYAEWLSARTGQHWRLPSEMEWEKAARGVDGRRFPWGETWMPGRLNSADQGPFDTLPVGTFPAGASPFGLLDAAGQVFEWTSSPAATGHFLVKGGSWDDRGCGVCRPAARHGRPAELKHILIGFRLVRELS